MSNQVRYLNVKSIGWGAVFNWRASQYTARLFFGKLSPGQCSCSKIEAKREKVILIALNSAANHYNLPPSFSVIDVNSSSKLSNSYLAFRKMDFKRKIILLNPRSMNWVGFVTVTISEFLTLLFLSVRTRGVAALVCWLLVGFVPNESGFIVLPNTNFNNRE